MVRAILPVLFCTAAWSQVLMPAGSRQARELEKFFNAESKQESKDHRLACRVLGFPTRLSFGFQYWSGYDISLPVKQFANSDRKRPVVTAVRVKAVKSDQPPAYLYSRIMLPSKVPAQFWTMNNVELNMGGGFAVGPGKYEASLRVLDSNGRTCRKDWKLDAKAANVPLQLEPGQISDSGLDTWKGLKEGNGTVSIYLHAAPMMRRRITTRLSAWDRTMLASSLRSLLDAGGFAKARLRVFDFDGRRVIYETADFTSNEYEKLLDSLMNLNLGTVSYQTLQGPNEEEFLSNLMREEAGKEPADAIVFLGPAWRWGQKVSPALREMRAQMPPTYYVSLTPGFASASVDLIEKFVKAGPKGKVLEVFAPQDLAKAIRDIRERRN